MQYLSRFLSPKSLLRGGGVDYSDRIERLFVYIISFGLLLLLPLILPLVRRAAPVALALAGVCSVLALIATKRLNERFRSLSSKISFQSFSFFILWCLISAFWSTWPFRGIAQLFLCAAMVFCGSLLYSTPPHLHSRLWLTIGILTGSAITLVDLSSGGQFHLLFSFKFEPYLYNMVLVTLLLLPWGLLNVKVEGVNLLRVAAIAILISAIFVSESETAKIAILVGLFAYGVGFVLSRDAVRILALVSLLAVWSVSMFATDVFNFTHDLVPAIWSAGHANERLQIWHSFSLMGLAGQPWGWGLGASAAPQLTSFYQGASPEIQSGLNWWHPHNNFLQIWVELGVPGVCLAFLISVFLILPKMPEPAADRASFCGFLASFHFIAMVSHGLWQTWWWAAVIIGGYAQLVTRGVVAEAKDLGRDL